MNGCFFIFENCFVRTFLAKGTFDEKNERLLKSVKIEQKCFLSYHKALGERIERIKFLHKRETIAIRKSKIG